MIDEKRLIEELRPILNEHGDMYLAGRVLGTIDMQPQADKWIPCSERLPSKNIEVLVTVEEIDGGKYTKTSWLQEEQWAIKKTPLEPKVIAWQPLPQPYKKEGAE